MLVGALLVTIATPATWPLALAAFLVRGGIILFLVPIVVLPTPVGLGDALGPFITSIAFGTISDGEIVVALVVGVGLLVALGCLGWLASALEAEGIRIVATDEETTGPGSLPVAPVGARSVSRILVARLVAHAPLVITISWGTIRLVGLTYDQLTNPGDSGTPLVIRVVAGSPEVVVAVVLTWMVGQSVGAIAARAIVIRGSGVADALRTAIWSSVHQPIAVLARFWIPTVVLAAVLIPSVMAAAAAWAAVAATLRDPVDPIAILVGTIILVVLWATGLLLTSVVCAWRSASWTVAAISAAGTFGGSVDTRPGDWRTGHPSAKV